MTKIRVSIDFEIFDFQEPYFAEELGKRLELVGHYLRSRELYEKMLKEIAKQG